MIHFVTSFWAIEATLKVVGLDLFYTHVNIYTGDAYHVLF